MIISLTVILSGGKINIRHLI